MRDISEQSDPTIDRLDHLFTAVVSDVLDAMGFRDQVMAPRVRPLFPSARIVGRARTVRVAPTDEIPDLRQEKYKLQLMAIDSLKQDDVLVVSQHKACFWGELMSVAAQVRGARGVIIDGYARDVTGITGLSFPTFVTGISAADALGRSEVVELGGEIVSGDVRVKEGDLVIADYDGVVVIPEQIRGEVFTRAEEKVSAESTVRRELEEGIPVSVVFNRYGIL